jgi:hypothetical protein
MRRLIFILLVLILAAVTTCVIWRRDDPESSVPANSPTPPPTPPPAEDVVQLLGGTGSHLAAILLDGRRASCVSDEVVRTTDTKSVVNILSPPGCDSRVAVLVQDRAMYFADVGVWTDNTGDTLSVTLAAMPQLPLSIWVPTEEIASDALVHADEAGPIYNDMQCGVGFEEVVPIEQKADLKDMIAGCSDLSAVKAVGYSPGRLNVYYVQEITDTGNARGVHCRNSDPTVILISVPLGLTPTLSHEIGHALSLKHTTDPVLNNCPQTEPDAVVCNLMKMSGTNQRLLSTGQCFRCNLNSSSALNTLGARTGPTPGCDPVTKSPQCPALSFDVVPK